eukprot:CAMPEP_0174893062 /NCGR_PEP_ID=MMETSP0167-20121228/7908_1 /TAXON_ID=38298 /ORGANISM="Rhodella maculata, Strain CCMP736" /LENGTH=146 /DNA_ID=CAMNT_0016131731 /DNA_START=92 /DNA_END=532 /DNA_ORIENTATION=+
MNLAQRAVFDHFRHTAFPVRRHTLPSFPLRASPAPTPSQPNTPPPQATPSTSLPLTKPSQPTRLHHSAHPRLARHTHPDWPGEKGAPFWRAEQDFSAADLRCVRGGGMKRVMKEEEEEIATRVFKRCGAVAEPTLDEMIAASKAGY